MEDKDFDRLFKVGLGMGCVWALLVLAFWAAVIYVVLHFIIKVW